MYTVRLDKRVEKQVQQFSKSEKSKISRVIDLFESNGFLLYEQYLKKLSTTVWELRPGNIRLLFGMIDSIGIIVVVFIKKTNKTPRQYIELAEKRLTEYL